MWLVVGLGNPGKEYDGSRHNIGFMVLDALARRHKAPSFSAKFKGELAQVPIKGAPCALLKPLTFMNLSGQSVQPTMAFFKIALDHIIVIHDDMDLELGQIKLKRGGGAGGHNGLRSIDGQIGPEYLRVRAGIGHPGDKSKVTGFVLTGFRGKDADEAAILVEKCADAVESLIHDGLEKAQMKFHPSAPPRNKPRPPV